MTEVVEMLSNQPAISLEIVPAQEILAAETVADSNLADLTDAVDAAYAEAGLEDALERKTEFKLLGSGDGLGYPKEVH
jgi:hypothetical protein